MKPAAQRFSCGHSIATQPTVFGASGMQPEQQAPSGLVKVRPSPQSIGASHVTPSHNVSIHRGQQ